VLLFGFQPQPCSCVGGHHFLSAAHSLLRALRKRVHLKNGSSFKRCHHSNSLETSSFWVGLHSHQLVGCDYRGCSLSLLVSRGGSSLITSRVCSSSEQTAAQTASATPNRYHSLYEHPGRSASGQSHIYGPALPCLVGDGNVGGSNVVFSSSMCS